MPAIVLVAYLRRYLVIDRIALYFLCAFFVLPCLAIVTVDPYRDFSIKSVALMAVTQLPLATRQTASPTRVGNALDFYSTVMLILCLAGVAQFLVQYVIPQSFAFPVDYHLPGFLHVATYNSLNPLEYGADKLKSNGVVFAEPSFFSQAAALAAIVELGNRRRPLFLGIFICGLFVSYSGTGMILLALFGGYYFIRGKHVFPLLLGGLLAGAIATQYAEALRIDTITDRLVEFTLPGTSGYARFVSIFDLIGLYQSPYPETLLFGTGPGQATEYLKMLPFEGFAPTWGKLFFEYGVLGSVVYFFFMLRLTKRRDSRLAMPIFFTYLFLGGYLSDTAVLIPLLLFVAWAPTRQAKTLSNASSSRRLTPAIMTFTNHGNLR